MGQTPIERPGRPPYAGDGAGASARRKLLRRGLLTAVLVIIVLLALTLFGQQPDPASKPPQNQPRFETRVDLVMLDVSVLDRNRRPVRGLTAADFTVLEDGRPQPVQTFEAIDLPDVEVASAPWVRDAPPDVRRNDDLEDRRILAIVMDDALPMDLNPLVAPDPAIPFVKKVAGEVVRQLGPRDLAAVVFPLSKNGGQDFTSDRDRLLKAIDRWSPGMPDGDDSSGLKAMRQQFLYRSLMSTIRMLTDYLAELPHRRKAIVLVSEGIPVDLEELNPAIDLANNVMPRGILQIISDELRETFAAAHRANVSIYPIDPAGLRTVSSIKVDFLRGLATQTGGYAVVDTNDAESGVRQILAENSSYYLLGYSTDNPRMDGRFRKIAVKVNRPDVTVRARTGYFEPARPKPSKKAPKAPDPTWKALGALMPQGDVAMQATAVPFAVPGQREDGVAIVVALRQPLPAGQERIVEQLDLLAQAFDSGGTRRAGERMNVRLVLRPEEQAQNICYEVFSRVNLKPGRYQLRLAASSSMQGKSGSVYLDVDVPDFSKGDLSLSGVLLSVTPHVTVAGAEKLAGLVPVVPTTERAFDDGVRVVAFARIYQGGKRPVSPVAVTARMADGTGTTVFENTEELGAGAFAAARAADYQVELPIGDLASGQHLLTIEARLGERTARRDIPFQIR